MSRIWWSNDSEVATFLYAFYPILNSPSLNHLMGRGRLDKNGTSGNFHQSNHCPKTATKSILPVIVSSGCACIYSIKPISPVGIPNNYTLFQAEITSII